MGTKAKKYDNSILEEASAIGERAKGAAKEGWGSVTGNEATKREGERESAEGRARQSSNRIFGGSTDTKRRWMTGAFKDRDDAESAYCSLTDRGYTQNDVNLLMSDETRKKYFGADMKSDLGGKAMKGAGAGGAIGGTLGAIIAALATAGTTLVVPGLGLVIAGPIAAALAGAGAGGLTGGIIGALVRIGIPEDRAKLYDEDIRNGRIVMGVNPRSEEDADYFEREWRNSKGENIYR
jgi:uncharacterized protein YjbJ (UPF0337 family)